MSSIKRDVKKKALPRPEAERIFVFEVLLESLEKRHPSKTTVGIRFSSEAELP
jgi:hypothetical protein